MPQVFYEDNSTHPTLQPEPADLNVWREQMLEKVNELKVVVASQRQNTKLGVKLIVRACDNAISQLDHALGIPGLKL